MSPNRQVNELLGRLDSSGGLEGRRFLSLLPDQPGFVADFLLGLLFSGIIDDPDQVESVRKLPDNAIVVYLTQHKSHFEKLLYYHRFRRRAVPHPTLTINYHNLFFMPLGRLAAAVWAKWTGWARFGRFPDPLESGFLREQLIAGRAAFMSLVEPEDFYRRFVHSSRDIFDLLLAVQRQTGRPVIVVPLVLFFDRKPAPKHSGVVDLVFGTAHHPGKLRRLLALIRKPGRVFFEIAEPLDLEAFAGQWINGGHPDGQAGMALRYELLSRIEGRRQAITGPMRKSHLELEQQVLTGERMQGFLAQHAKRRNIDIRKARKEAAGYLNEIAARPNPTFIQLGQKTARRLMNAMFDGVTVNEEMIRRLKSPGSRHPIIFMPCHKSNMDSLLVSYLLYTRNMQAPLIFAGKNLSFWPMGPVFRRLGAFFVRRSLKGAVFYARVLSEYIYRILAEGHSIEVFIEGTRSRSGKLLPPQKGMISILLNACKAGACRDLTFVPVSVGYDSVPEESAYLREVEGGRKAPENMHQMIRARKLLKKRYGRVYVNFNEPVALSRLLEEMGTDLDNLSPGEQNRLCRHLGRRVLSTIDAGTPVSPRSLVAAAMLSSLRRMDETLLVERFALLQSCLIARGIPLAESLLMDVRRAFERVVAEFQHRKLVEPVGKESGAGAVRHWRVPEGRRPLLEFYKNNAVAPLVPVAFTALRILEKDAFQFSAADLHTGFDGLSRLFSDEFTFDPDLPAAFLVRKIVKFFIDEAVLIPHQTLPDTYNLTARGFRVLVFYALLLKPFFEAYLTATEYMLHGKKVKARKKDLLRGIRQWGFKMYKDKEIERRESINQIYYGNALAALTRMGIKNPGDKAALREMSSDLRRYLALMAR